MLAPREAHEFLLSFLADRHEQPSADLELLQQRLRHRQRRSRHQDAVEGRVRFPAERTVAVPAMATFDAAARETCVVRQTRTNTPLQALNLLNDVAFVEAARSLAARMMKDGGSSPDERIAFGFRLALARGARPEELALLRRGFERL